MPGLEDYHWYPPVHFDYSTSPYGPPQQKTLDKLISLGPGTSVVDVAGGYGRYAEPLAMAGLDVTIIDIDPPHMEEAERRAANLPDGSGQMRVVEADVVSGDLSRLGRFDALLCTGFLYLAPQDVIQGAFHRMIELIKPGGLSVVEFATNRLREDMEGNSLMGSEEQNYTWPQGVNILTKLYQDAGISGSELTRSVIDLHEPYRFYTDLIIASGVKPE